METVKSPDGREVPPHATFETERLYLRTFYPSDAEALLPILSDPEIMRWTAHKEPITDIAVAQKWTNDRALGKDVFNFIMMLKPSRSPSDTSDHSNNEVIGIIGARFIPEVGYLIRRDHFNKGYASEAFRGLIPRLFDRMPSGPSGFNYIEACTNITNVASQRVMEKCGLTRCPMEANDITRPSVPDHMQDDIVAYRIARPGYELDGLWVRKIEDEDKTTLEQIEPVIGQ